MVAEAPSRTAEFGKLYPLTTGYFAASQAAMPPASSIRWVIPYWWRMLAAMEER
jgi:hypothetical protein